MAIRRLLEGVVFLPNYLKEDGKDLSNYIEEAIKNKTQISRGSFNYVLCKPIRFEIRGNIEKPQPIFFAILLKMTEGIKEMYFDEEKWAPKEEEDFKKHVKTYSRFLLFTKDIIVLEEQPNNLSKTVFLKSLKEILEVTIENHTAIYEIDIRFKKSAEEIKEFLEKSDKITSIKFSDLFTPNPYDFGGEKINNARNMIKRLNTKKMSFENPDGLNVDADEISGTFGLIDSGMGEAKIHGIREDEHKVYETKNKIKSSRVDIEDDLDFINKAKNFLRGLF